MAMKQWGNRGKHDDQLINHDDTAPSCNRSPHPPVTATTLQGPHGSLQPLPELNDHEPEVFHLKWVI